MSALRMIELISYSSVSCEDAAEKAIEKATRILHNVKSIYVQNQSAKVEGEKIVSYGVNVKVSFMLD